MTKKKPKNPPKIKNKYKSHIKGKGKKLNLDKKNQSSRKLIDLSSGNKSLTDYEINTMSYKKVFGLDKRSFCEFYISLIKTKQILFCIFCSSNDFNSTAVKFSLFCFILSFNFSINLIFFNESLIHKIYINKGIFNIMEQILYILISSFSSIILNIILKAIFLSDRNIIEYKENKDKDNDLACCLKIKYIFFYLITLLSSVFFWIYVSCFCIVYQNTQILFIKISLISFGIIFIYPFIICIFPGIFRIMALSSEKKDKDCLYSLNLALQAIV